jgi:hypothetical protein
MSPAGNRGFLAALAGPFRRASAHAGGDRSDDRTSVMTWWRPATATPRWLFVLSRPLRSIGGGRQIIREIRERTPGLVLPCRTATHRAALRRYRAARTKRASDATETLQSRPAQQRVSILELPSTHNDPPCNKRAASSRRRSWYARPRFCQFPTPLNARGATSLQDPCGRGPPRRRGRSSGFLVLSPCRRRADRLHQPNRAHGCQPSRVRG